MTCRRSREIELEAFLIDAGAPEWAEFRTHYPRCPDCSAEIARWTQLEGWLRSAAPAGEPVHPAESLLVRYEEEPVRLTPAERRAVAGHLEACAACRSSVLALRRFDFGSLESRSRSHAGRSAVERLREALRLLAPEPGSLIPRPALALAAALLIAIPVGVTLWRWGETRGESSRLAATSEAPVAIEPEAATGAGRLEPGAGVQIAARPEPPGAPGAAPATPTPGEPGLPEAPQEPQVREPSAAPTEIRVARTPEAGEKARPAAGDRGATGPGAAGGTEIEPDPLEGIQIAAVMPLEFPEYAVGLVPTSGGPSVRVGEVVRSSAEGIPTIRVLAPDHIGLTTQKQPTLYWFASRGTDLRIEFTLIADSSETPLLETTLPAPRKAGVRSVALRDFGVHLVPGVTYRWFVSVIADPAQGSGDAMAGGAIERTKPRAEMLQRLAAAGPGRRGHVYAESGIFYDALDVISRAIEADPTVALPRNYREALLDQVGLSLVADHDRRAVSGPAGTSR
jgi:anti-sigma factor RsiW